MPGQPVGDTAASGDRGGGGGVPPAVDRDDSDDDADADSDARRQAVELADERGTVGAEGAEESAEEASPLGPMYGGRSAPSGTTIGAGASAKTTRRSRTAVGDAARREVEPLASGGGGTHRGGGRAPGGGRPGRWWGSLGRRVTVDL